MVTRKEKIGFICKVVDTVGQTQLGKNCGKYFRLFSDDVVGAYVESFEKNNTYGLTAIGKLSTRNITKIYNDLLIDFA